jgi:hypothetical protein
MFKYELLAIVLGGVPIFAVWIAEAVGRWSFPANLPPQTWTILLVVWSLFCSVVWPVRAHARGRLPRIADRGCATDLAVVPALLPVAAVDRDRQQVREH